MGMPAVLQAYGRYEQQARHTSASHFWRYGSSAKERTWMASSTRAPTFNHASSPPSSPALSA